MAHRFESLDGLRGVAALIVVVFHFLSAFMPFVVPDQSDAVPWWVDTPIGLLYNGTFAVPVFFVLSGFVLAHSSMRPRERLLFDMGIRYLRLALPATASIALAWLLLKLFPTATQALASDIPGPWLKWTYQAPIPSFLVALREGALDVFWRGGSQFNNVLWTMRTELLGSFGVFLFFQLVRSRRLEIGTAAIVVLVLTRCDRGYVSFGLGALLYLWKTQGFVPPRRPLLLLFFGALLVGSWSTGFASRRGLPPLPAALEPGNKTSLWYSLAALLVVAGALYHPTLSKFFSSRVCTFLGRISFPLYLVHVPLLYTVAAFAALKLSLTHGVGLAVLGAMTLAFAVLLALVFERSVDIPVMMLLKRLRQRGQ